jgi:hypothetical protein
MRDNGIVRLRVGESDDGRKLFIEGKPEIPGRVVDLLVRRGLKPQIEEVEETNIAFRAMIKKCNVPPPQAAASNYFVQLVGGVVSSVTEHEGGINFDPTLRQVTDSAISLFESDNEQAA